jgi:hypothetical protein
MCRVSKRSFIALVTLIVLALGISAFALMPELLGDGGNSAQTAVATGGADSTTGTGIDTGGSGSTSALPSSSDGSSVAEGSEGDSSGVGAGVEDGRSDDDRQSSSGSGASGSNSSGASNSSGSGSGSSPNSGSSTNPNPNSTDSGNNANSQQSSQQPAPASQLTATLSIDAETMGRGYIIASRTVTFTQGETVFDVLQRECRNSGIPMEFSFHPLYNTRYIEGIDNLYEFDGGPQSGWMYSVNGWYPNYGCGAYVLRDGDVIKWRYTCNLGSDIGGANALG